MTENRVDRGQQVLVINVPQTRWQHLRLRWFVLRRRIPEHLPKDALRRELGSHIRFDTVAGLTAVWTLADRRFRYDPGFLRLWSHGLKVAECRYKLLDDVDGEPADSPVLVATNLHVNVAWRHCGIATAMLTYLLHHYPTATLAGEAMNPSSVAVHVHLAELLPGRVHHQPRFHHLLGLPTASPEIPNLFPEIPNPGVVSRVARYRRRLQRQSSHVR